MNLYDIEKELKKPDNVVFIGDGGHDGTHVFYSSHHEKFVFLDWTTDCSVLVERIVGVVLPDMQDEDGFPYVWPCAMDLDSNAGYALFGITGLPGQYMSDPVEYALEFGARLVFDISAKDVNS